jgi:hypothetical protein
MHLATTSCRLSRDLLTIRPSSLCINIFSALLRMINHLDIFTSSVFFFFFFLSAKIVSSTKTGEGPVPNVDVMPRVLGGSEAFRPLDQRIRSEPGTGNVSSYRPEQRSGKDDCIQIWQWYFICCVAIVAS